MASSTSTSAGQDDSFTSFLLVGKTGEGKSSTGNSILGKNEFKAGQSTKSITKNCKRDVARVQDRKLIVVDSPGLADTDLKKHEGIKLLEDQITQILTVQPDGFDAILITIPHGRRLTPESCQVLDTIDAFFGKHYVKHFGIVVLTYADLYDPDENDNISLEEYTRKQTGEMAEMLHKCHGRLVWFDNKTKDDKIRSNQVKRLLDMVINMKQSAYRYTSTLFKKAQEGRDKAYLEAKEPFIRQETEDNLKIILQDVEKLLHEKHSTDIQKYKIIQAHLVEIEKKLKDDDKKTGVLFDIITRVSNMEAFVSAIIANCQGLKDQQKKMEKELEDQRKKLLNTINSLNEKLNVAKSKKFDWSKGFIAAGAAVCGAGLGFLAAAPLVAVGAGVGIGAVAGTLTGGITAAALQDKE